MYVSPSYMSTNFVMTDVQDLATPFGEVPGIRLGKW